MGNSSSDRQVLLDASNAADEKYELLSDRVAAALESGENVTPELVAAHSSAMYAAIEARKLLEVSEGDD